MSTATLPPPTRTRATIDDLMRFEGKAELIGGKVAPQMPAGFRHNRIAGSIFFDLKLRERTVRDGVAITDNLAFRVAELSSERESFSPNAAYVVGSHNDQDPSVFDGPPTFAVEVRSPDEYGPAAERDMTAKRDDYFEAGLGCRPGE
jgi:Uma2 family endonuclease